MQLGLNPSPNDWITQGDVFESIPLVRPTVDEATRALLIDLNEAGPAVLLTHSCQLDKRTRAGKPSVKNLNFAAVTALETLDANQRAVLLREEIDPSAVMYLGDIPGMGEAFCALSSVFTLPVGLFSLTVDEFPQFGEDEYRAVCASHKRICSMNTARSALLHTKLQVYWTRQRAKSALAN